MDEKACSDMCIGEGGGCGVGSMDEVAHGTCGGGGGGGEGRGLLMDDAFGDTSGLGR